MPKIKHDDAPKAPPKLERKVAKWKSYWLLSKDSKGKSDAMRAEIAADITALGAKAVVTKLGTIPLQTTTRTEIDWEALARKFITPEILETAVPAFTKTVESGPFISAPRGWGAEV